MSCVFWLSTLPSYFFLQSSRMSHVLFMWLQNLCTPSRRNFFWLYAQYVELRSALTVSLQHRVKLSNIQISKFQNSTLDYGFFAVILDVFSIHHILYRLSMKFLNVYNETSLAQQKAVHTLAIGKALSLTQLSVLFIKYIVITVILNGPSPFMATTVSKLFKQSFLLNKFKLIL